MDDYEPIFGVVAESLGNTNFTPGYTKLEEGVNSIILVWQSGAALTVYRSPLQSASAREQIGSIPAGSVSRTETLNLPGLGVKSGESAYISCSASVPAGTRVNMQVMNIPLRGGLLRKLLHLAMGWSK